MNYTQVKFAGTWYNYEGTATEGALYVPGTKLPFAFLADGVLTKNGIDELIGDVEGLLFQ